MHLPLLGAALAFTNFLQAPAQPPVDKNKVTFEMTIVHTNDLHGHWEPTKIGDDTYGGYARLATLIKKYRAEDPDLLLVDAGDVFQGTLYFNVYQGMADLTFLTRMGYRAMAVGNHEFDLGPEVLANFARRAPFPLLSCNLDLDNEPALKGLIKPYTIVTIKGEKVGLIGATTPDLPMISSPGPNVKVEEPIHAIEEAVEDLEKQGVNKIVLLSHLGYTLDKEVVRKVREIDVVVGGHSHTLFTEDRNAPYGKREASYPTYFYRAESEDKDKPEPGGEGPGQVPEDCSIIVSSFEWGKVLGHIKARFNYRGWLAGWRDAAAIPVDGTVAEDPEIAALKDAFSRPIDGARKQVIGTAKDRLNGDRAVVRKSESTMGDLIADSMVEAGKLANVQFAIVNGGGVRNSIEPGQITVEAIYNVLPFGNGITFVELTGAEVLAAFEHGASGWEAGDGMFPHVSEGVKLTYDMKKPKGSRLVSASLNGQPFDAKKVYNVAVNSFIARGGDGYTVLARAKGRRIESGVLDSECLLRLVRARGTVSAPALGRVTVN
ncbi:MAG: 5'-nucleotidase C-terminal domain-containing protein [Armatimonadetes bacterium]|nr:5'-nucleotidase C-terminal domain-containing protein [Armatimonadota bacterium]